MRARPIEVTPFSVMGILYVNVFVLQLCTLLFVAVLAAPQGATPLPPAGPPTSPITIEARIPRDFRLPSGLVVTADPCPPDEFGEDERVVLHELSNYSTLILNATGLRRIVLCSGLRINGKEQGGLAIRGMIMLNIKHSGIAGYEYFRRSIHHEIFHLVDDVLRPGPIELRAWEGLNPPGFQYEGSEILEALEITGLDPSQKSDIPGFVDHYARVSMAEDRAELYAFMVASSVDLATIAREDKVVAQKVRALEHDLKEWMRVLESRPAGR